MDLVVRNALAARTEVTALQEHIAAQYSNVFDPSKLTELTTLQVQLTNTLSQYAPDASIALNWADFNEIDIPMPRAQVKLSEDGYETVVERTGHGVQRAFILTMLQHLVAARGGEGASQRGRSSDDEESATSQPHLPNLLLAIEEPELYQHPSRQRHMAAVLRRLAEGSTQGVAKQTQVMYSTHAPLFVGLDRVDQIKLLRKHDVGQVSPKVTAVAETTLDSVANELWILDGQPEKRYTSETLRPRLQVVMTPWMNEGFFADVVVLVEGGGDRSAVHAVAEALGHDLESMGICVVAVHGEEQHGSAGNCIQSARYSYLFDMG